MDSKNNEIFRGTVKGMTNTLVKFTIPDLLFKQTDAKQRFKWDVYPLGKEPKLGANYDLAGVMIVADKKFTTEVNAAIAEINSHKILDEQSKLFMAGFFYVIFLGMALFFGFMWLPWSIWRIVSGYEHICAVERFFKKIPLAALALLPLVPLFLHLCANLHWQFYCAVGVIKPYNCFWVFDGRSLLVGFAGLIGLAACAFALILIAFLSHQLYRLACYLSCLERVEKGTPGQVKSLNI